MEYILEMNSSHQLTIPAPFVDELHLAPGAHFVARLESGRLIIERLPFSRLEAAKALDQTVQSLHE